MKNLRIVLLSLTLSMSPTFARQDAREQGKQAPDRPRKKREKRPTAHIKWLIGAAGTAGTVGIVYFVHHFNKKRKERNRPESVIAQARKEQQRQEQKRNVDFRKGISTNHQETMNEQKKFQNVLTSIIKINEPSLTEDILQQLQHKKKEAKEQEKKKAKEQEERKRKRREERKKALIKAIGVGNLDEVRRRIYDADPSAVAEAVRTAVEVKNLKVVKIIKENRYSELENVFFEFVTKGNIPLIQFLLRGYDEEYCYVNPAAISSAVDKTKNKEIKVLLQKKIEEIKDKKEEKKREEARAKERLEQAQKELIKAASIGDLNKVKELILSVDGLTFYEAIIAAVKGNHTGVVSLIAWKSTTEINNAFLKCVKKGNLPCINFFLGENAKGYCYVDAHTISSNLEISNNKEINETLRKKSSQLLAINLEKIQEKKDKEAAAIRSLAQAKEALIDAAIKRDAGTVAKLVQEVTEDEIKAALLAARKIKKNTNVISLLVDNAYEFDKGETFKYFVEQGEYETTEALIGKVFSPRISWALYEAYKKGFFSIVKLILGENKEGKVYVTSIKTILNFHERTKNDEIGKYINTNKKVINKKIKEQKIKKQKIKKQKREEEKREAARAEARLKQAPEELIKAAKKGNADSVAKLIEEVTEEEVDKALKGVVEIKKYSGVITLLADAASQCAIALALGIASGKKCFPFIKIILGENEEKRNYATHSYMISAALTKSKNKEMTNYLVEKWSEVEFNDRG